MEVWWETVNKERKEKEKTNDREEGHLVSLSHTIPPRALDIFPRISSHFAAYKSGTHWWQRLRKDVREEEAKYYRMMKMQCRSHITDKQRRLNCAHWSNAMITGSKPDDLAPLQMNHPHLELQRPSQNGSLAFFSNISSHFSLFSCN